MKRTSIRNRSAFTLIEVLLALALVGMAVTVILQLFSSSLRNISSSEDYVRASIRAESRLRDIVDDAHLAERRWSEATGDGYRIDVAVSPVHTEKSQVTAMKLLRVDLSIAWRHGMKNRAMSLSTLKLVTPVEENKETLS
jgi:prepilin-type N-terminal cleavage/methylation domain-containing protein